MKSTTSDGRTFLGMRASAWALVVLIVIASAAGGFALAERTSQRDTAEASRDAVAGQSQQLVECVKGPQVNCEAEAEQVEKTIDDVDADPEVQDAEIQDPEIDDPEPNDPDPNDPEVQDPEVNQRDPDDPELQDGEVQDGDPDDPDPDDPELQDPEVDDPENQDPEIQDPEVDDPDPNSALMFAVDDSCSPPAGEYVTDVGFDVRRGDGVVTYVITCSSAPLPTLGLPEGPA